MLPPQNLDLTAISGLCGSISLACWIVVFSPQILTNFRRGSASGLSVQFIIVWLSGDVCNILGAVLQGVLPTMLILAIYYAANDVVLLGQCFYYRGFTWRDEIIVKGDDPDERTRLLGVEQHEGGNRNRQSRRASTVSISATHLSPVVPLIDAPKPTDPISVIIARPTTRLQAILFNFAAVIMVISAGVLGWYITERRHSSRASSPDKHNDEGGSSGEKAFSLWGQIFGYSCAILYLSSRIPQILLNYRRKSTEGVAMLFFMFACIGNLTYVLSIFAYDAKCAAKDGTCRDGERWALYWRYIGMNASWLAGSAGTLFLDFAILTQFFIYGEKKEDTSVENGSRRSESRRDQRPLLDRGDSVY